MGSSDTEANSSIYLTHARTHIHIHTHLFCLLGFSRSLSTSDASGTYVCTHVLEHYLISQAVTAGPIKQFQGVDCHGERQLISYEDERPNLQLKNGPGGLDDSAVNCLESGQHLKSLTVTHVVCKQVLIASSASGKYKWKQGNSSASHLFLALGSHLLWKITQSI